MQIGKQTNERMEKSVQALVQSLSKIRSGRAHVGLLDALTVNCYGANMPLSQLATVSIADSRTLVASVWDKQNVAAVEKAVRDGELGVNPSVAGQTVRVSLPPLSEERRRELAKLVGKEAEDARVAARNIRRDQLAEVKKALKDKAISEDESKRLEQEVQKITDGVVQRMDGLVADKQKELMTV